MDNQLLSAILWRLRTSVEYGRYLADQYDPLPAPKPIDEQKRLLEEKITRELEQELDGVDEGFFDEVLEERSE